MDKRYNDVFISYCNKNKEVADFLKEVLNARGISCWMAPYNIPEGTSYASEIIYGIKNSKVFILVLSSGSLNSTYVLKELDRAIAERKKILPFQIEKVNLNEDKGFAQDFHYYLCNVQRINAVERIDEPLLSMVEDIRDFLSGKDDPDKKETPQIIDVEASNIRRPSISFIRKDECIEYVERPDYMETISKGLFSNDVICVSGIYGIGKHELVSKFYNNSIKDNRFKYAVWLSYTDNIKTTLASVPFDYFDEEKFFENLRRCQDNASYNAIDELYGYKYKLLNNYGDDLLIVIDNADKISSDDMATIASLSCKIIIISQHVIDRIPTIKIGALNKINGRELFFKIFTDGDRNDETQNLMINQIIEYVGGHALTIKLIAKVAQITGMPLDELFNQLSSGEGDLFTEHIDQEDSQDTTILEQLDKVFDVLSLSEEQKRILAYMAVIPFSGIKKYDFKKYSKDIEMIEVDRLIQTGWLLNEKGTISEHPLVIKCVRRNIKNFAEMCTPFVKQMMDSLDISGIRPVLHMQEKKNLVKSIIESVSCNSEEMISIYSKAGMFLNSIAYQNMIVSSDDSTAVSLFHQVVNVNKTSMEEYRYALNCVTSAELAYEKFQMNDQLLLGQLCDAKGAILFNMNCFGEARKYHLKAYELRKNSLNTSDLRVITSARRKAISAFYMGQNEVAENEFNENLIVLKSEFGNSINPDEMIELAKGYSYVGKIKTVLGKSKEAREAYTKAIELLEATGKEEIGLEEVKKSLLLLE